MNTQPRGLRLLCPQGCGTTLTIAMPTLAEVKAHVTPGGPDLSK